MGMTIDEAIKHYEDMKKGWYLINPDELFDFTIETLRKYQKICKTLDKSDNGEQCMYDTIQEIEEVRDGYDE